MRDREASPLHRLIRTLGIRYVAFFVWDEVAGSFRLELASDRQGKFMTVSIEDKLQQLLDLEEIRTLRMKYLEEFPNATW